MFDRPLSRRTALSHAATALAGATGIGVLDAPDDPDDADDADHNTSATETRDSAAGRGVSDATDAAGADCDGGAIVADIAVVGARGRGNRYVAKAGEVVTFDASETASRARIDSYQWDLGPDGRTADRVHQTWDEGGVSELVSLTVTDVEGNTDTARVWITVESSDRFNDAPTPFHDVSPARTYDDGYIVQVGDVLTFDATGSTDPDGEVVAHEWSFRYGAKEGAVVEHSFRRTGNYEVTLTVTDDDGERASVPIPVHVNR